MGYGGMGYGGMGMGGMGYGGMGYGGMGYGGMGYGGMGYGGMGYGGMGYGGMGYGSGQMAGGQTVAGQQMAGGGAGGASASSSGADMTGSYLGMGSYGMFPGMGMKGPRVVPNPTDNSLLILGTGEEYESILRILRELDIPPRQVLIEARIFEVRLTGAFSWGLAYYLQNRSAGTGSSLIKGTTGGFINSALSLTSAAVVSESKELLALLSTQDLATKTKMISAPSVIATDSIAASINVGADVPTLTSQAVTGAQQNGNSLFANTISNRQTGVTLGITARVNPSGIVTLMINQQVSSPQAPPVGGIQSPSFSTRSVSTQVTVQDGDMVAIGGIINETDGETSTGIPYLHRIPGLGFAFGNKSKNRERTEMVIFMTPRVIYDTNDIADAGQEIVSGMKRIQKQLR
jgi:general secretion pathway protein D